MKKSYKLIIASICILAVATVLLAGNANVLAENPFNRMLNIEYPSFSTSDTSGNTYFIDKSMKRVVKVSNTNETSYEIKGGKRGSGKYYFASEIAVDDKGYLYLANTVMALDGIFVEKEEILKYSPEGTFEQVMFSKEYEENSRPMTKGYISSLKYSEGTLYFFYRQENDFQLYKIPVDSTDTAAEPVMKYDYKDAGLMLIDYAVDAKTLNVFYSTKKGEIYKITPEKNQELLYSGDNESTDSTYCIPWELDTDFNGNVYFTDIGKREIREIAADGSVKTVLSNNDLSAQLSLETSSIYYRLSVSDTGNISTVDLNSVFIKSADGKILFYGQTARYSAGAIAFRLFIWFLLLVAVLILIYLLKEFFTRVVKGPISSTAKISGLIILVIVISAIVVSNMIFKNFLARYEGEVLNSMANTTQLVSKIIDGDTLERITKLEDFMNDDYKQISKQLHDAFNDNQDDWNANLYCVLHKVKNDLIYSCMYYEDTIGTIYPLDWPYKGSEFETIFNTHKILKLKASNPDGDWIYALGPVYNSKGDIIAIIEIGTDLYAFNEANSILVKNIILEVLTIAVVLILFLIEIIIFAGMVGKRRENGILSGSSQYAAPGIIRPLAFIAFTADCMASAFLPMLAKQLYKPFWGLSESMLIAIPISAEILFSAIFAAIGGYLIDKKGWRPVMLSGFGVFTVGLLMCGFSWDSLSYIVSKSITGAGFGLAMISMTTFIVSSPSEDERNNGFSMYNAGMLAGVNCGVVVGAMLSESMGYSKVYWVAAAISLFTIVFVLIYLKNISFKVVREKFKNQEVNSNIFTFLFNRQVFAFFIFALIPYLVCGYFLHYFFPLFAESQGMSASNISRAFLLNGLCVIYLGPVLAEKMGKHFGLRLSVIIAGVIYAASLFLFSFYANLTVAFIVVVLLGFADSFGFSNQTSYFSNLKAVGRLGGGKSMGFYSLFENLGQTIGPFVFASAALMGTENGIRLIAIILVASYVLFSVITIQSRKSGYKRIQENINL